MMLGLGSLLISVLVFSFKALVTPSVLPTRRLLRKANKIDRDRGMQAFFLSFSSLPSLPSLR